MIIRLARAHAPMFLVPTYLSQSHIHGTGVYTPQPIKKGTVLWEFHEGVDWHIAPEDLAQFPEPYQSRFRMYCFRVPEGHYVFCGDNAKFMNHSDTPNCDDPAGAYTVANRDIETGEELTSDYRTFDLDSAEQDGALYDADGNGFAHS